MNAQTNHTTANIINMVALLPNTHTCVEVTPKAVLWLDFDTNGVVFQQDINNLVIKFANNSSITCTNYFQHTTDSLPQIYGHQGEMHITPLSIEDLTLQVKLFNQQYTTYEGHDILYGQDETPTLLMTIVNDLVESNEEQLEKLLTPISPPTWIAENLSITASTTIIEFYPGQAEPSAAHHHTPSYSATSEENTSLINSFLAIFTS